MKPIALDNPARKYRLPFNHRVIAELSVAPDWYYVTIYHETDGNFVTYQCNAYGECAAGHYGFAEKAEAILNMLDRSPVPIFTLSDVED